MNFAWSESTAQRIARTREFAGGRLASRAPCTGFDRTAWSLCAEQGILGMILPKAWGGEEEEAVVAAAVFEALGRGGADRGLLFAMGAHVFGVAAALAKHGSTGQQMTWGRRMGDGSSVAALAVTEPQGGSSTSMAMTAEKCADGFVLNGAKTLVTNAPDADVFLVVASTSPQRGAMGLSAFLVPSGMKGLVVEPLCQALGMAGAPMGKVSFEGVVVPESSLMARPGAGLAVLSTAMQHERTLILAGFLGAAERDLALCVDHLKTRGSMSLLGHQAVAHRLARMRARIESARWMLYRGAWALNHAKEPLCTPAMVKLTVSEALVECALDVQRCMAGAAWLDEHGVASGLRDVIGTLSASGTSDVQLNVIASSLEAATA